MYSVGGLINLDQLSGVSVDASPNIDDRDHPEQIVDMDHAPDEWFNSPTADFETCVESAYMTVDLGTQKEITGVTIWHYYGNDRAYCNQKLALSKTGVFGGEVRLRAPLAPPCSRRIAS